jgi:hypothetical protein
MEKSISVGVFYMFPYKEAKKVARNAEVARTPINQGLRA